MSAIPFDPAAIVRRGRERAAAEQRKTQLTYTVSPGSLKRARSLGMRAARSTVRTENPYYRVDEDQRYVGLMIGNERVAHAIDNLPAFLRFVAVAFCWRERIAIFKRTNRSFPIA